MWIIFIIIIAIIYYKMFMYPKNFIAKCNSDSNDSCKMYNQRDIQSKCEYMCKTLNPKFIFSGKHSQNDNEHICECEERSEKFTLDFTPIKEHQDILPDKIPNDSKFSDRNYLEKEEEQRYRNLIFG